MITYTPKDLSDILNLNIQTVGEKLRSGEIPGTKVGGSWRTTEGGLEKLFSDETFFINQIF